MCSCLWCVVVIDVLLDMYLFWCVDAFAMWLLLMSILMRISFGV